MKQYDSLRKEIEGFIHEQSQLATYATLATGAVWSAVFIQPQMKDLLQSHPFVKVLLFVPATLTLMFFYRVWKLDEGIAIASDHLAKVEVAFGLFGEQWGHLAWDGYWKQRRSTKVSTILNWHWYYWTFMSVVNFAAAAIVSLVF